MKKRLWPGVMALAATMAWADTPAQTELLSAQLAYQEALKNHTTHAGQIATLQTRLQEARTALMAKQQEVNRLEAEVQTVSAQAGQAQSTLDAAGRRLDAAWMAVRGR